MVNDPPERPLPQASRRAPVAIEGLHTLAWFSIEACMVYLLYAGFVRRSDRNAAVAGAIVGGESLVFAASGFRCPLTRLAERLGARRSSITDIYLPQSVARNLPAIHVPLLAVAALLHARNLRAQRRQRTDRSYRERGAT
jgi:hypothetical protein